MKKLKNLWFMIPVILLLFIYLFDNRDNLLKD